MANYRQSTQALSLHHLPDLSQPDASVSFEIPLTVNSADLLLADNSDFLSGIDCSLTTPPPPQRALDAPLTLSELTPTPRAVPAATVQTPSPSLRRRNAQSPEIFRARLSPQKTPQSVIRMRLNTTQQVNSPVSIERFANLKAEVDSLSAEEVELSERALPQSLTAEPPAVRPKRDTKLRKGGERQPKMKPVRLRFLGYLPDDRSDNVSDRRRWRNYKERPQTETATVELLQRRFRGFKATQTHWENCDPAG